MKVHEKELNTIHECQFKYLCTKNYLILCLIKSSLQISLQLNMYPQHFIIVFSCLTCKHRYF